MAWLTHEIKFKAGDLVTGGGGVMVYLDHYRAKGMDIFSVFADGYEECYIAEVQERLSLVRSIDE